MDKLNIPLRQPRSRGAAWDPTVIARAVSKPWAASPVENNSNANYYWDPAAGGELTSLDAAPSGRRAQFSTRISYRSDRGIPPGRDWVLLLTVAFSEVVTLADATPRWMQTSPPNPTDAGKFFIFRLTPASWGSEFSVNAVGTAPGVLVSTASLAVMNGTGVTWAEPNSSVTELI